MRQTIEQHLRTIRSEQGANVELEHQYNAAKIEVNTLRERAPRAEGELGTARESLTTSLAASEKASLDAEIKRLTDELNQRHASRMRPEEL